MITSFSGKSADIVWRKAAEYFVDDKDTITQPSRAGTTQELLHASFAIENPRQRWVVSRAPSINPAFALVLFQVIIVGYSLLSLILASLVVNCQSTFVAFWFRVLYHAST